MFLKWLWESDNGVVHVYYMNIENRLLKMYVYGCVIQSVHIGNLYGNNKNNTTGGTLCFKTNNKIRLHTMAINLQPV